MATFPTLKVEIAFASDPLDVAPTWVDVSAYVRDAPGVQLKRGGNGEPQAPDQAGSFTFDLDNRTRRFDPTYAAGPYFGNLRARKQCRLTATWNAVDYPVMYGWVTGFPVVVTDGGTDSVVSVQAFDSLSMLAGSRMSSDPLYDYVASLGGGYMWLRQADATEWNDATGLHPALLTGTLSPVASPLGGMSSNGVPLGSAYLTMSAFAASRVPSALGAFTCSFWLTATSDDATPLRFILSQSDPSVSPTTASGIYIDGATGVIVTAWTDAGSPVVGITGTRKVDDGLLHHVAISSAGALYVDGVLDASGTPKLRPGLIGADADWLPYIEKTSRSAGIVLHDFLVLTVAATAAQVWAIYTLSRDEYVESTAARVTRILDDIDWPATWRTIATDTRGIVSELVYSGQSALTALQQIERSEQGRLFAGKDGKINFSGRYAYAEVTRNKTVQATLSDDGSDIGYMNFAFNSGDDDVCNDMTVRNNLNTSRSTDSASQTRYGTIADTTDTNLSSLAQVRDMAAGLVYQRKDAAVRSDPISTGIPPDWATVLGLELGDRVRIESTPMNVGSQLSSEVLIDAIGWTISAGDGWRFQVAGQPVPANGFWVLGTSLLGTSTIPGF